MHEVQGTLKLLPNPRGHANHSFAFIFLQNLRPRHNLKKMQFLDFKKSLVSAWDKRRGETRALARELGSLSKDDSNGNENARKQQSDWLNEEK